MRKLRGWLGRATLTLVVAGCSPEASSNTSTNAEQATFVELLETNYQAVVDGKNTDLFTIANSRGYFAKITNLGAKVEQLIVPDKMGVLGDVVLGYDTIATVQTGQPSMGAFMGRYANRIGGGTFTLEGQTYTMTANEADPKNNLLHGGAKGGRFRVYDAVQLSSAAVQMTLTYADAEDADAANGITGYPGTLQVSVTYTMTEQDELLVEYSATAVDKPTVANFTSHPFFNLGNDPAAPVLDHVVSINADKVLEINDRLLPTGLLRDVTNTPMDFRTAKPLRQDYQADYDLLKLVGGGGAGIAGGFDNHFAINKATPGEYSLAATAYDPGSGRRMEVWSTEPGLQLFTGNGLAGMVPRDVGKGNVPYLQYTGFCLEPSHYPDSPNQPGFPSTVITPGTPYVGKIAFKFSVAP